MENKVDTSSSLKIATDLTQNAGEGDKSQKHNARVSAKACCRAHESIEVNESPITPAGELLGVISRHDTLLNSQATRLASDWRDHRKLAILGDRCHSKRVDVYKNARQYEGRTVPQMVDGDFLS